MNGSLWMVGFGFWHWVVFVVTVAAVLYPIGKILGRLGLSPVWSIFALVPFVNLIALWVLAFADWPRPADKGA